MQGIRTLRARTVVLPSANIDTDQIIPARYLMGTGREGLSRYLFADWRYDSSGAPRADFVLNRPDAQGCAVLVAGRNFGCGSSREHAPWALLDYGFRAVISSQIADIFHSNSLKNGLVPIVVPEPTCRWLIEHPGAEIVIDVESTTLTLPTGERVVFPIESFAHHCLVNGIDELEFLLRHRPDIDFYEQRRRVLRAPRL